MFIWENDETTFWLFSASHEGNSDRSEDWFKGKSKPETMEKHGFFDQGNVTFGDQDPKGCYYLQAPMVLPEPQPLVRPAIERPPFI